MRVLLELGGHPVIATRIATATSQMARNLLTAKDGARIDVDLASYGSHCELILTFAAEGWTPQYDFLARFFQKFEQPRQMNGVVSIKSATRLENVGHPDHKHISVLSAIVQQKSRDELMSEIQDKNVELEHHREHLEETVRERTAQLAEEKQHSDRLLHMIIPREIARELLASGQVKPRRHSHVAVLFSDIAGFTPYCRTREPEEIVDNLHRLFSAFEEFAAKYELEKIKTIGDSFMAACGLLSEVENPVMNCVLCALEMIEATEAVVKEWQLRVGVHCGPIVAGVLGSRKQQYDLWGDTVNVASRMESHGVPGCVALSKTAWDQISHLGEADLSQKVQIKGLGEQQVFLFRRFRA